MERLSSQDSTEELVSEDAIFDEVLGSRSAYRKCWGLLPKGVSKSQRSSSYTEKIQLKEQMRQLKEQHDHEMQQYMIKLSEQQCVIDDLRSRTDELTAFMR